MKDLTNSELRARLTKLFQTGDRTRVVMEGYRPAGVLVPVVSADGGPELLFTKRTTSVETHKGQVSFPGGVMDPGDHDLVGTALRETWEEIGIPDTAVEVMGLLDDLPTPTGFVITPVVGILPEGLPLSPNSAEVEEVFWVPMAFFADAGNGRTEIRRFRGVEQEVWYFQRDGHTIWGATAMIVRSLLKKLDLTRDDSANR